MTILAPKLGQFALDYPDIVLDVTADDIRMDIVAGGWTPAFTKASLFKRI